jgi:hypothetical protein
MKAIFSEMARRQVESLFDSFLSSLRVFINTVIDNEDVEAVNKLLPNSWDIRKNIKESEEFHFVKNLDREERQAVAFLQLWRNGFVNLVSPGKTVCAFYYQAVKTVLQSYFATLVTSTYRQTRMNNFLVAKGYQLFVVIDKEEEPKEKKEPSQIVIINRYIQTDTDDDLDEGDDPALDLIELVCSECRVQDCSKCGLGIMKKEFFGIGQNQNVTERNDNDSVLHIPEELTLEEKIKKVGEIGGLFSWAQSGHWKAVSKDGKDIAFGPKAEIVKFPGDNRMKDLIRKYFK